MYRLYIPQAKSLETSLQSVDRVHRYADLIKDHVTTPVTVFDEPYPVYVLKKIASDDRNTYQGLHDIVEILKDTAYIACAGMTSSNRNGTVYKTSGCTFTSSETKDIYLMVAELNRRATSHQDILPHLQDLQEQWLDSYNHLTKRQIILKAQEKRISLLGKDHASYDGDMKRWLNYKLKVESATSAHNALTNNFRQMLYKERRLRLDMEELEEELCQLLSLNIEIRLQKTLENMAKTIDLVDLDCSNTRYQVVKSRIQGVNVRDIVESLLRNCSMEYEYPNIQEFIQTTGFSEPLPSGEMISLSRHRKVRMDDKEFLTSFQGNFGEGTCE
ncbi:uncharacterized protein LOC117341842 [Pecten maximus]|uniref:uncharacterized protein LOC117341842 n=1 Tax=Pecten maximus TaxID=6579 RepID=UPI0014585B6A|nr:uncharacterized protein LOC117341842 [Pecten maximus]